MMRPYQVVASAEEALKVAAAAPASEWCVKGELRVGSKP